MRTFVMVFKNKDKLDSMIQLRKNGWTLKSLALIYNVDHSSIYKACKIRGVSRGNGIVSLDIPYIVSLVGLKEKKIKTYQDYLDEQHRRKFPKLYSNV